MKRTILSYAVIAAALAAIMSCSQPVSSVDDGPAAEKPTTDQPTPQPPADAVISIAAIPGIVVPVRAAVPVTTAIDTEQYSGTVSWSPADDPFAPLTAYTATIALTAKAGFTLTGVAANFFTVAGAAAANDANSGIVTAVFPATGKAPDVDITFLDVSQTGGAFASADTTALTLTFDVDPTTLTANDITVTGATKGALTGTGLTRSLAISDVSVMNGATVSVTVASPAGYAVSGSPRCARVFRMTCVGMDFMGGKIGYILQEGDAGYDENVSHGLIVGRFDVAVNKPWANPDNVRTALPVPTGTAIGTGRANTEAILAQNGTDADYAANIARSYAGGGYRDWYLPSRDELLAIVKNRAATGMNLNAYMSSSEYDAAQYHVVWLDEYLSWENKSGGRKVCAVRDF